MRVLFLLSDISPSCRRTVVDMGLNYCAPASRTFPLPGEYFIFPWLFSVIANIRRTFGTLENKCIFRKPQNFHIFRQLSENDKIWWDTSGNPRYIRKSPWKHLGMGNFIFFFEIKYDVAKVVSHLKGQEHFSARWTAMTTFLWSVLGINSE